MASVITSRRPQDPSRLEIEARKAELQAKAGWNVPERDYLAEVNGLLLEQCDDQEDYRLPESLLAPARKAIAQPQEMSKADRCNIDLGSLFELNDVPRRLSDRFKLGDIDPETTDLSGDSLAELHEATHKPIAFQLKTEAAPPFKSKTAFAKPQRLPRVVTDVRSFRSKRK
jgi:hypothetical protein